jgi:hypothetical protein
MACGDASHRIPAPIFFPPFAISSRLSVGGALTCIHALLTRRIPNPIVTNSPCPTILHKCFGQIAFTRRLGAHFNVVAHKLKFEKSQKKLTVTYANRNFILLQKIDAVVIVWERAVLSCEFHGVTYHQPCFNSGTVRFRASERNVVTSEWWPRLYSMVICQLLSVRRIFPNPHKSAESSFV